jgi:hypothetical protein
MPGVWLEQRWQKDFLRKGCNRSCRMRLMPAQGKCSSAFALHHKVSTRSRSPPRVRTGTASGDWPASLSPGPSRRPHIPRWMLENAELLLGFVAEQPHRIGDQHEQHLGPLPDLHPNPSVPVRAETSLVEDQQEPLHRCAWRCQPIEFRLRFIQAVISRLRRSTNAASTSPVNRA